MEKLVENEVLDKNNKVFCEYLIENAVRPNLIPTQLESVQVQEGKIKQQLLTGLQQFQKNLSRGGQLLAENCPLEDLALLNKILDGISNKEPFQQEWRLLAQIGAQELGKGKFHEAELIFQYVTYILPTFGSAWVGWAVSAQEQGNVAQAEQIFTNAVVQLPKNLLVQLSAARFFAFLGHKEKAKKSLEEIESLLAMETNQECMAEVSNQVTEINQQLSA